MALPPGLDRDAALCDFRLQAESDSRSGALRPLREYLARFPGFEEDVAREYLTLTQEADAKDGPEVAIERYERAGELGRGGMGVVERVHDHELDRELARKVLRRDGPRFRRRFQEETRITSLLDHPGVVPLHDRGVDEQGRPYFTMRLVEGIDFELVIQRVHAGDAEWTMPRALEALVKVCDTMAYAHTRGIVHRDLKPSNVRVGRFGEVYVMDWGLARDLSAEDHHEIRPRVADVQVVHSDEIEDGLSVVTLEGDVLGTPAYMPPEQARGDVASVGPRSDVYSVGAMLRHLLTGRRPYSEASDARGSRDVLALVIAGAPPPIALAGSTAPQELVAICAKAMHRDPRQRYAHFREFGDDLRAYLDGRVVRAHRTGRLARARKWIARNRALSAVLAFALAGSIGALIVIALGRLESRQRLLQLSGSQLKTDFDSLWPPHPAAVPVLERWIADAREYTATIDDNDRILAELRGRALPRNDERPAERRAATDMRDYIAQRRALIDHFREIDAGYEAGARGPEGTERAWVQEQIQGNEAALHRDLAREPEHLTFEFRSANDQRLHDAVRRVRTEQAEFESTARTSGLLSLAEWGLAASRRVEHDSLVAHAQRWDEAIRSIADRTACPAYDGLSLGPQLGLVPIGRDPASGLHEFWHVLSGAEPVRDEHGLIVPDEAMGIVLVLVPGGWIRRGSQGGDPQGEVFDPGAEPNAPLMSGLDLRPFFVSKYEMTRGQWQRIAGSDPSHHATSAAPGGLLHPVENVSFQEARRILRVAGLNFPTEAQWEYAARAGTSTPWPNGRDLCTLAGCANVADLSYALSLNAKPSLYAEGLELNDGWSGTAPIGTYLPNAFGLHDVSGNVREWCGDRGPFSYLDSQTRMFTGERIYDSDGTKAARGGSFVLPPARARAAAREQVGEFRRHFDLGIRPARRIDD